MYVDRSMQRGYTRKELGISWTKFQRKKFMGRMKANANMYVKKFELNFNKYRHKLENDPYLKRFKGNFKKMLGMPAPELQELDQDGSDEDSDFDV